MSARFLIAALAVVSLMSTPFAASAASDKSINHKDAKTQTSQSLDDYEHPKWIGVGLPPIDYMGN